MPVHAIDHSISRKDGVNHNMLVLFNNFWIGLLMDAVQREEFESIGGGIDLWPEVGSRMMLRLVEGQGLAGGWVEVERGRYRYAVDWTNGVTVRTIIWDYLATETSWLG